VDALGGQPAGDGAWYQRTCYSKDGRSQKALGGPVWMDSPPAMSPQIVAHQAVSKLDLPAAVIVLSPARRQLVGLPTWMAVSAGSWDRRTTSASAGRVTATATAVPTVAVWSMGDGTAPVRCRGRGSVWQPGMNPRASSPDCGHTYHRSSAASAGGTFRVGVSVSWSVSWHGAGRSGSVPGGLTTTGSTEVTVAESQALIQ